MIKGLLLVKRKPDEAECMDCATLDERISHVESAGRP